MASINFSAVFQNLKHAALKQRNLLSISFDTMILVILSNDAYDFEKQCVSFFRITVRPGVLDPPRPPSAREAPPTYHDMHRFVRPGEQYTRPGHPAVYTPGSTRFFTAYTSKVSPRPNKRLIPRQREYKNPCFRVNNGPIRGNRSG